MFLHYALTYFFNIILGCASVRFQKIVFLSKQQIKAKNCSFLCNNKG